VDEFGSSGRREGLDESPERRLHLVEGHSLTVIRRADG
jgi:hypothetical protein